MFPTTLMNRTFTGGRHSCIPPIWGCYSANNGKKLSGLILSLFKTRGHLSVTSRSKCEYGGASYIFRYSSFNCPFKVHNEKLQTPLMLASSCGSSDAVNGIGNLLMTYM
jgi:hypothetical protein